MTVYLLDKAMGLDTVGLFRYTACIMVVEAASIAQRGPAARPLLGVWREISSPLWEPDEAQPHLLVRDWSKQSGSLACAASYRQAPACSARLGEDIYIPPHTLSSGKIHPAAQYYLTRFDPLPEMRSYD